MGGSYLLKDKDGRVSGYLLLQAGQALCRVSAKEEGEGTLVLQSATGKRTALSIKLNGEEHELTYDMKDVSGAFVASGGRIRWASDDGLWSSELAKDSPEAPPEPEARERPTPERTTSFPERRWPRPACWSEAEYRDGRWSDQR